VSESESQEVEGQESEPSPDAQPPEHSSGEEAADAMQQEAEAEEAEGEQEPEPEASGAAGAVGEKELERMFKKVDAANAAYLKRLEGIMEAEIGVLEPCPRCSDPFLGLIFPPLMRPVSPEVKAAVLVSVGEDAPTVSKPDQYSRQCETCEGWGRVLSGSKLNAQATLPCISCNAKGWVAVGDERRVPQQAVAAPAMVIENGTPVEQPPDTDPWGRGPTDPDYGRLPQFVGV